MIHYGVKRHPLGAFFLSLIGAASDPLYPVLVTEYNLDQLELVSAVGGIKMTDELPVSMQSELTTS